MNREPLDVFLYKFNRNEKWARLFTFAMTALGLFVVLGLVGLTTWGFASYSSARSRLSDTSQQLEMSQKKIGELEASANSNTSTAAVMKLQQELANTQQLVATKDAEIQNLKTQLGNSNTAPPTGPNAVPQDCSKCESTIDQQAKRIQELTDQNKALSDRLNNCPELIRRCRNSAAGAGVVNKPVVVQ